MEKKTIKKTNDKFNWKLVLVSFMIIALVYIVASMIFIKKDVSPRETLYCQFEKRLLNDSVPRNECGILKIVTKNMDAIDMEQFRQGNRTTLPCAEFIEDIPSCEGETYHYTEFTLRTFCDVRPCDVDGFICGAYYVTYYNQTSNIELYEELMFTDSNIESEAKLLNKLDGCGK